MALNPYFLQGSQAEQRLVQNLVNEQLKIFGAEVTYIPRKFVNQSSIIEEVQSSKFDDNFAIEAYINTYDGKSVWGVNITESGLLAAAHLAGSGNVKRFFQKGLDFKDANGTKMTFYMKQFGGYKLNI